MSDQAYRRPQDFPLGQDACYFYRSLQLDAGETLSHMQQSWQRPVRHNKSLERMALAYALNLDVDCMKGIASPSGELLRPSIADAPTRYEIQAGILTVSSVLPFSAKERETLRGYVPGVSPLTWSYAEYVPKSDLVDRWHEWLWADEQGARQRDVSMLGASATLAMACDRLAVNVGRVLGF